MIVFIGQSLQKLMLRWNLEYGTFLRIQYLWERELGRMSLTVMQALQSQGLSHRGLKCTCPTRCVLHWAEWPGLYTHTLMSHWRWPPGKGMLLSERANSEAGDNWRLSTNNWGKLSFLEWVSECCIFRSTTKIMEPLLVIEKDWKQIMRLSIENWLNQLGYTSPWNIIQVFKWME